jgi:hypothetical protein
VLEQHADACRGAFTGLTAAARCEHERGALEAIRAARIWFRGDGQQRLERSEAGVQGGLVQW